MARVVPFLYAVLRIVTGILFFLHGTQKLFGFPPFASAPPRSILLMSLPGAAGMIECITGALIATGFYARPAAFLASGEMAFAYFLSHAPRSSWPTNNLGEAAVFNCFFFLYVAAKGPGILSVNSLLAHLAKGRATSVSDVEAAGCRS